MILIFDSKYSERVNLLRESVLSFGTPCAAVTAGECRFLEYAKAILTFEDTVPLLKEHFPEVDPEIILISDSSAYYESETLAVEIRRVYGRLHEILLMKHGIDLESYCVDRFTQINGVCKFAGNIFYPTDKEKIIIKTLTLCPMRYFTAQEIVMFCSGKLNESLTTTARTIAVHVSHINRKTKACSMKPIIETKRNYGYRFVIIR